MRTALAEARELEDVLEDFQHLREVEAKKIAEEKQAFVAQLETTMTNFEESLARVQAELTDDTEGFLQEKERVLGEIFELVVEDASIEDAFNERVANVQACEDEMDLFFKEQGEHVRWAQEMQSETATLQQTLLDDMTRLLRTAARDLLISSYVESSGKETEENRAQLVSELIRLERQSGSTLETRKHTNEGITELARLVGLEEQKLALAMERRAVLQKQIRSLKNTLEMEETQKANSETSLARSLKERLDAPETALQTAGGEVVLGGHYVQQIHHLREELERTCYAVDNTKEQILSLQNMYFVNDGTDNFGLKDNFSPLRTVVSNALLEVGKSVRTLHQPTALTLTNTSEEAEANETVMAYQSLHMLSSSSQAERRAIQNFVARRINAYLETHPSVV
ncbi:hypothetical protein AGDE_14190 [Angomonas deanei]|nr:hypothetical protein AGDE_14190 [Angomonas deanei]|eukprot:EPY21289.1 hypothetical protein AGDE_14190 [Angomonas deanei]